MERSKRLKLFGVAVIAVFIVVLTLFVGAALKPQAAKGELDAGAAPVKDSYFLGETLDIAERQIVYKGQQYSSSHYLIRPDKKAVSGNRIVLEYDGQYTLVYYADVSGVRVKAEFPFYVADELYSVSSGRSSVFVGADAKYGVEGVVVGLASGDTFDYNRVVNISSLGSTKSLLSMVLTPETIGVSDAQQVNLTITDAYDRSNYVVISVKQNTVSTSETQYYTSYATANAGEIQIPTGIEKSDKGTLYKDGTLYRIHQNNKFGAYFNFSMTGRFRTAADIGSEKLGFLLNTDTKYVYVRSNDNTSALLVSDLDDRDIYDTLWGGFTTDEVYLSVSASAYNNTTFNFVLKDVAGVAVSSENVLVKNTKPLITVETGDTIENGIVGLTYPVFPATARSAYDNELSLTTRVFYSEGSVSARFEVDIINGRFKTDFFGTYTIVYTAKDRYGNVAEERVDVNVIYTDVKLKVEFDPSYKNIEAKIAAPVQAAPPIVTSYYSDYKVTVSAKLANSDISYAIGADYTFTPEYAGEYDIVYECSDLTDSVTASYRIDVDVNDSPVLGETDFPKYLIAGATYSLPIVNGIDYSTGRPVSMAAATITVIEKTGNVSGNKTLSGNRYTVAKCDEIEAVYSVTSAGGKTAERKYSAKVVDVGYGSSLDLAKYFYDANGAFTYDKQLLYISYVTSAAKVSGGKASLEFVNKLSSRKLEFTFNGSATATAYTGISVILRGVNGVSIKMTYRSNGNSTDVYLNDVLIDTLSESLSERKVFSYDEDLLTVSSQANSVYSVGSYISKFNGIGSTTYLGVEIEGVSGNAGFDIARINRQTFGSANSDVMSPNIDGVTMLGAHRLNEKVTIKGVNILDILDPDVSYTFKVLTPNGTVAYDVNGLLLDNVDPSKDYEVILDAFGNWQVEYTAQDSNDRAVGRKAEYAYSISVPDTEPPTVTLSNVVYAGKVGSKIALAKATVTDNMEGDIILNIMIKDPFGRFKAVSEDSFVADVEGKYTVYYYAIDVSGNYAIESYIIEVTK